MLLRDFLAGFPGEWHYQLYGLYAEDCIAFGKCSDCLDLDRSIFDDYVVSCFAVKPGLLNDSLYDVEIDLRYIGDDIDIFI